LKVGEVSWELGEMRSLEVEEFRSLGVEKLEGLREE